MNQSPPVLAYVFAAVPIIGGAAGIVFARRMHEYAAERDDVAGWGLFRIPGRGPWVIRICGAALVVSGVFLLTQLR